MKKTTRTPFQLPLVRREFLHRGFAGLAALSMPGLLGCSSTESGSGATVGGAGAGGAGGGGAGGAGGSGGACLPATIERPLTGLRSNLANLSALQPADKNGLLLPRGFTSRVIGRPNEIVPGTDYAWHILPDGGATFATQDGGWIYVSNSEIPLAGGVGAMRFDKDGTIASAYSILSGTNTNCAGGKTPWGTWLSCEEVARGRVFECDPFGETEAVERPALGIFKHEAVAVDLDHQHLYLTEDVEDGRLYRYVPDALTCEGFADLEKGRLEVAEVRDGGQVLWHPVPDPAFTKVTPTRHQVPQSTPFNGGEGIVFFEGIAYFSTKGDNRVWAYDVAAESMSILYDAAALENPILTGVDNLAATCCGDVLVAEDSADMQIVAILTDGTLKPLVQVDVYRDSEITGLAFDPSGTRLYFNSQRGAAPATYEVSGPFHLPA